MLCVGKIWAVYVLYYGRSDDTDTRLKKYVIGVRLHSSDMVTDNRNTIDFARWLHQQIWTKLVELDLRYLVGSF